MPRPRPIPGFNETDWMFIVPSGYDDPETGERVSGGSPYYSKRFIRLNAFPDAPDGRTGAADAIIIRLDDIEQNPTPEAIGELVSNMRDMCEMSLRDLFEQRGVPFPNG